MVLSRKSKVVLGALILVVNDKNAIFFLSGGFSSSQWLIFFSDGSYHYKGAFDCLKHTIQNEGLMALYKGFLPTYIRMVRIEIQFL